MNMDDEKLISLVKQRDVIYNKHNPLFKLSNKKAEAWLAISWEMGELAIDCMKRWTLLRDRFSRESRKFDLDPDNYNSSWPFFQMMQFIKPYVTTRATRTSKYLGSNRKLADVLQQKSHKIPKALPPASPTHSIPATPEEDSQMECADFGQISNDPLIEMPSVHKKAFISNPDVDKSFCEAVEALKRVCALNEVRHKNPAVYAFGEMIVSTICSMNSRNQIKVMQQVTDTVMRSKLQEDELSEEVSYSKI